MGYRYRNHIRGTILHHQRELGELMAGFPVQRLGSNPNGDLAGMSKKEIA